MTLEPKHIGLWPLLSHFQGLSGAALSCEEILILGHGQPLLNKRKGMAKPNDKDEQPQGHQQEMPVPPLAHAVISFHSTRGFMLTCYGKPGDTTTVLYQKTVQVCFFPSSSQHSSCSANARLLIGKCTLRCCPTEKFHPCIYNLRSSINCNKFNFL